MGAWERASCRRGRRAHPHRGQAGPRGRGLGGRRGRHRRGRARALPPPAGRRRADRHHAPGHRRLRGLPVDPPQQRRARSSWSRPAPTPTTWSPASRPAPTTTSPSRSPPRSCRPASGPCCAGPAPPTPGSPTCASATSRSSPTRASCAATATRSTSPRPSSACSCELASKPGPGVQPRGAARAGLGLRLLRRRPPGRRPRPPPAHQGRGRPRQPPPRRHRAGPGLQAPGLTRAPWRRFRLPLTRRLGLRARITLAFALGALAAVGAPGRHHLGAHPREPAQPARGVRHRRRVLRTPRIVQAAPAADTRRSDACSRSLPDRRWRGSQPVLYYGDEWFTTNPEFGQDALPAALQRRGRRRAAAADAVSARRRAAARRRHPASRRGRCAYFEIVSLDDVAEHARRARRLAARRRRSSPPLAGAAPRLVGQPAGRCARSPRSASAAEAIAGGRLDTRLEPSDDPDLRSLTASFNDMAQALQDRIERDARFASDVSHELRSPLMTLAASVEVLENRATSCPSGRAAALDLHGRPTSTASSSSSRTCSRSPASTPAPSRLELEEVHLAELVMQAVSALDGRATSR